ncbi:hypothetical protein OG840_23515 [Streptomyces sp. NBC_01764]|uniref:Rv1733c family protein n=1 Tax=Streptomyces sp. NBC_01764 TaxID=2975935 RepID=UPI002252C385|nr:hypothetical protein [Streptomyces sp. NBC_01764]MCX4404554.1 hypothetical protein [Streptomyces sp. NBC_01764]
MSAAAAGGAAWSTRGQVQGPVRWTAPDGTSRTGQALIHGDLKAGARVTVWQDDQSRLTTEPTDRTEAAAEAGLFGFAVAAPTFGVGGLVRWQLDRRRTAQWDREWNLVGRR